MSDSPNITVKDFDPEDRPQEKAEKYGVKVLTLPELWALILRSGQPGVPITQLTRELMRSNGNKLRTLERRTREELMLIPGIGRVKALQIEAVLEVMRRYEMERFEQKAIIRTAKDIYDYMRAQASGENVEHIWIMTLSRSNMLLNCKMVSTGGTSSTVFDIKTILREIIATPRAERVVMVHNHPSGNLRPSPQDDSITRSIKEGCQYLGLTFMDHVIVAQDGYYSYFEENRL